MPLVTSTEMFKKAYEGGYAIGAFNVNNMEIVQGITEAAKEENAPLILQVSAGARKYAKHAYLMKLVEAALKDTDLPICLHLDHGADFEICKACVDGGFTSVMIDGSQHSFEDNIALTKKVVEYAHAHGVVVEGELGKLAGIEDDVNVSAADASYTRPDEVEEFVEKYFNKMRGEKTYFDNTDFIEGNKLVSIAQNPDTVVAYGVGVTVGMKERNKAFKERILTDVCPFTLGIEVIGQRFAPIIPRNTTVPTSKSEYFSTVEDNQTIIRIAIYQGESLNINDNLFLGEFEINVPRNNAGNEKVNVRFTYDINGILEAEATAMSTGEKRNKLIINGDLSEEEKNERIKTLEEIKIQSENQNKDKLLIERANRIYAEIVNTEIRNYISEYLENYQMIVRTGDRIRIQKVKKEFSAFLDKIDPELNDLSVDDILRDIDEKEEDEAVEEEDELEFWN